jgi:hypothetical protein
MKKVLRHIAILFVLMPMITGCRRDRVTLTPQQVATSWANMTLFITKNTPANSPTFASRGLGYIGVTMYESVVHGYPEHRSMIGQLNELDSLPLPESGKQYDWVLAMNAGQAEILRLIYIQTSDANKHRVDSLENVVLEQYTETISDETVADRSVRFGKDIAHAIFEWSKSDGGHRGYLKNFDKSLTHESFPGCWEPPLYGQSFSHFPLHPHWGENRTFLKENDELSPPDIIKFDTSSSSPYYQQFYQVYEKSKILTSAEKETALWWGDDPGDTFTPPGHSYYLATLVLNEKNPDLITCAETYARVGVAVADAFILCWRWKYHYFSERPSSFISKHIDNKWESFWPDPPFPAFPSGHATQAGAVASVLTAMFGDGITLVDSAHAWRAKDELRNTVFRPRTFRSFLQVAEETANSRFYGGIHTPQDNEIGLREGKKMGDHINKLSWTIEKEYAQH